MIAANPRPRLALPAFVALALALALAAPAAASAADFSLTVEPTGSGSGAWECEVQGGGAEPCKAEYAEGLELTVLPKADPDSEFLEFGGDCGPAECELTMDEEHGVSVLFEEEVSGEFSLTISKAGAGAGTVECEVEGAEAEPCEGKYAEGTEIGLVATANAGSTFAGFSAGTGSAASCTTSPCSFTIEANSTLTATFNTVVKPKFKLTVSKSGSGTGTLTSTPAGINCGATCEAEYDEGTEVTLSPAASAGSQFTEWSGACSGSGACKVTLSAAKAVGAKFDLIAHQPEFTLTIEVSGNGSGLVNCDGGACAASYEEGAEVTLSATAIAGSFFAGWSGEGCSGTGTCEVTIEADTTIVAKFTANPFSPPPPSFQKGTALAAGIASVQGESALIRLLCPAGERCTGTLELFARLQSPAFAHRRHHGPSKSTLIGTASFDLAPQSKASIAVKITSARARRILARAGTLSAQLVGTSVRSRTVRLVAPQVRRHRG